MAEDSLGKLYVEVSAKTDKLEQELNRLKGKVSNDADNMTSALGSIGSKVAQLAGGFIALNGVIDFGKASVQASIESAQAIGKVEQALKTIGGVAGYTSKQLSDIAGQLSEISGIDDDKILNDTTAQLLTFTNITGTAFERAQQAALDLSAVLGTDLKGQSIQVGKALERPIEGLAGLQRAGITFTEKQKEMIKSFMAQNDIMSAQNIILTEIETKYGGQAKVANDAKGGIDNLSVAYGNLQESIGGAILNGLQPLISKTTDFVKSVTPVRTNLEEVSEASFQQRTAFEALVGTYERLRTESNRTAGETKLYKETIQQLKAQYPDYLSKLDLEKGKYEDIASAINKTREALIEKAKTDAIVATQKDYLQSITDAEAEISKKTVEIEKLKAEAQAGVKSYTDKALTGTEKAQGLKINGLEKDIKEAKNRIQTATSDLKILGDKYKDVLDKALSGDGSKKTGGSGSTGGTGDGTGKDTALEKILKREEEIKKEVSDINAEMKKGNIELFEREKLLERLSALYTELHSAEKSVLDKRGGVNNKGLEQTPDGIAGMDKKDPNRDLALGMGIKTEKTAKDIINPNMKEKSGVQKPEVVKETTNQLRAQLALSTALEDSFNNAGASLASGLAQSVSVFKEANSLGEQFVNTLVQMAVQALALSAIGAIGGGGVLGFVGGLFGAHNGGTFVNQGGNILKMASGGSFIVPGGYPNDSFPLMVESGERVTVTPSNQVSRQSGNMEQLLSTLINRVEAQTIATIKNRPVINVQTDIKGNDIVKNVTAPAEKKLKKVGVNLND